MFGEAHRLLRFEESVRLLVAEEPRLQLHVGAVVVRERLAPPHGVGVVAPRPHLVRGQLRGIRDVHGARARVRMVHADIRLARPVREERHGTVGLVADDAEIAAVGGARPRLDAREAVRRHERRGIHQLGVVPRLDRRVRPPVVAVPRIAAVAQRNLLLEPRLARTQTQLYLPRGSEDRVDVAHPDRSAAVFMRRGGEVDRGHGHPVMRDREVELDPERGPGAAIADERLLDGAVRVEHVAAAHLVEQAVHVPAEVGQHGEAEVFVLEVQRAPRPRFLALEQRVADGVGIVHPCRREHVEGRVRVGGPFERRRQGDRGRPDADGCLAGGARRRREQQGGG